MNYMSANNMPPVVSPAANAAPNAAPNLPFVSALGAGQGKAVESAYLYPYAKPRPPVYSDWALVLVLFILLVIITRGVAHIGGKC